MAQAEQDRRIDYIEFSAGDIEKAKAFYSKVFGWKFTDYGPGYTSFDDGRILGGFSRAEGPRGRGAEAAGPLVVIYAKDLAELEREVRAAGGTVQEQIEFPGGRRFYFLDPVGNRLAVWTDH
jgi:uncharacterized protein